MIGWVPLGRVNGGIKNGRCVSVMHVCVLESCVHVNVHLCVCGVPVCDVFVCSASCVSVWFVSLNKK